MRLVDIKQYWERICNIGIESSMSLYEKNRIQLLNSICGLVLIGQIFLILQSFYLQDIISIFLTLLCTLIFTLPLFLHAQKKFVAVRAGFIITSACFITFVAYVLGNEVPYSYPFVTLLVLSVIFMDKPRHHLALLSFMACAFLLSNYLVSLERPFDNTNATNGFYIMSISNTILIYLSIKIFMTSNITYAKQTEKLVNSLQENNQLLETQKTKIGHQNKSLAQTNKQLEQANKELESFAYIASHDLKTPLRNTHSFLQLIERKLESKPDKDLSEYLNFCLGNTQHMQTIIEDILGYSKLNKEIKLSPVSLEHVFEKTKKILHQTLQEKEVVLKSDTLPTINGNESQFLLLFQNLIENGIKYNNSQPIELHIELVSDDDQQTTICFHDNGIGIAPEYQEQIFEMFKRLHNQKTYDGTGIGLATCHKIVSRFSGKIWVESEEGQGCSFFVQIPKHKTEAVLAS